MAETRAKIGYGTLLQFGDGATPTEGFTTVAEVQDITGPGMTRDVPEATHMTSPGAWREFIDGLKDGGELTFDCNHLPDDATQDATTGLLSFFSSGAKKNWRVVFPVSPEITWTFAAIVMGFEPSFPVDDRMMMSITLKVSGPPAFLG